MKKIAPRCQAWWARGKNKGIIMISFLMLTSVLVTGTGSISVLALIDSRSMMRLTYLNEAFYLAEAGVDQKLAELMTGNTQDTAGNLGIGGYLGNYNVDYTLNPLNGEESLVSTGTLTVNGQNYVKSVRVTLQPAPVFAPLAAVTISGVAETNGNVTVDGRDHDSGGVLTGAPGLPGIATSSDTFMQSGSSEVGGSGIVPANPAHPATYMLNAPPLPNTPEAYLGLSDGALNSYKTQTPPLGPFNGIVYLTSGWTGVDLNGSTGILICHNTEGTAYLKNIHGTFKGLIITDDIIHINGDAEMIGAVVGLKTGGVTLGNGAGYVKFSSQVLSQLPLKRYTLSSWQDTSND